MTDNRAARTCGSCRYRIEGECRCCPPQIYSATVDGQGEEHLHIAYPPVYEALPACALWQHDRRGNQPRDASEVAA